MFFETVFVFEIRNKRFQQLFRLFTNSTRARTRTHHTTHAVKLCDNYGISPVLKTLSFVKPQLQPLHLASVRRIGTTYKLCCVLSLHPLHTLHTVICVECAPRKKNANTEKNNKCQTAISKLTYYFCSDTQFKVDFE